VRTKNKQVVTETTEDTNVRCLAALLGEDLRTWRLQQRLPVGHAARIVGVGRSSWYRWEIGLAQPGSVHIHLMRQMMASTSRRAA